ncbi:uncharacterized protein LOC135488611 [Lineus longissimus]|uniref:uncharacterized protein LOC135488611 n=1 Tax=Lineus longissimus TaxID=88925 RepID=UPI00315C74F7
MYDIGGFELAKSVTNSAELMQLIPEDRRAKSVKELDLDISGGEIGTQERVLGVSWEIQDDSFMFKTRKKDRPLTRRGLLGHIASLFDPEGSIAPVTLKPKQILQRNTRNGSGWDDPLVPGDAEEIERWLESISKLSEVKRPRYIVPKGFGEIKSRQLHVMSDGSESGYGYVLFAYHVNSEGKIHVSFVLAKTLVTPAKKKTIPRIELQAALLSMGAIRFVVNESDVHWDSIYQWVDSTAVLAMLKNHSRRFKPYCANRLQEIRDTAEELKVNMRHVPGTMNIADICSRGLDMDKFFEYGQFYNGPEFLWGPPEAWPVCPAMEELPDDYPEFKRDVTVAAVERMDIAEDQDGTFMKMVEPHSDWTKLRLSTAWLLRFKTWCLQTKCGKRIQEYTGLKGPITVKEITSAEIAIVSYVQQSVYKEEIGKIGKVGPKMKKTQLHKLQPFVDGAGSLRVGGRLTESNLPYSEKHQLILPQKHHLSVVVARYYHVAFTHAPPRTLLYLLRKRYWIIHGTQLAHMTQERCITCIRSLANPKEQLQGVLPKGRVASGNLWFETGC